MLQFLKHIHTIDHNVTAVWLVFRLSLENQLAGFFSLAYTYLSPAYSYDGRNERVLYSGFRRSGLQSPVR